MNMTVEYAPVKREPAPTKRAFINLNFDQLLKDRLDQLSKSWNVPVESKLIDDVAKSANLSFLHRAKTNLLRLNSGRSDTEIAKQEEFFQDLGTGNFNLQLTGSALHLDLPKKAEVFAAFKNIAASISQSVKNATSTQIGFAITKGKSETSLRAEATATAHDPDGWFPSTQAGDLDALPAAEPVVPDMQSIFGRDAAAEPVDLAADLQRAKDYIKTATPDAVKDYTINVLKPTYQQISRELAELRVQSAETENDPTTVSIIEYMDGLKEEYEALTLAGFRIVKEAKVRAKDQQLLAESLNMESLPSAKAQDTFPAHLSRETVPLLSLENAILEPIETPTLFPKDLFDKPSDDLPTLPPFEDTVQSPVEEAEIEEEPVAFTAFQSENVRKLEAGEIPEENAKAAAPIITDSSFTVINQPIVFNFPKPAAKEPGFIRKHWKAATAIAGTALASLAFAAMVLSGGKAPDTQSVKKAATPEPTAQAVKQQVAQPAPVIVAAAPTNDVASAPVAEVATVAPVVAETVPEAPVIKQVPKAEKPVSLAKAKTAFTPAATVVDDKPIEVKAFDIATSRVDLDTWNNACKALNAQNLTVNGICPS